MNDSVTVKVLHCQANLVNIALDFKLVESLSTAEQIIQGLVLTQLEQDVDVFSVFKEVLKAYDVVLVE